MKLIAFSSMLATACAHMGMSWNGNKPRDFAQGDSYRNPDNANICHIVPRPSTATFEVQAGTEMTFATSGGAGHGGGHCVVLVSVDGYDGESSGPNWIKVAEQPDCTKTGGNANALPWTAWEALPADCDTERGCTIAWLWTPINSGTCEIYMNCWDVRIRGAVGGIEVEQTERLNLPISDCKRPGRNPNWTTMFGEVLGKPTYTAGDNNNVVPDDNVDNTVTEPEIIDDPENNNNIAISASCQCQPGETCYATNLDGNYDVPAYYDGDGDVMTTDQSVVTEGVYNVVAGDTMFIISDKFDLLDSEGENDWRTLCAINEKEIGEECDTLAIGEQIKLPLGSCSSTGNPYASGSVEVTLAGAVIATSAGLLLL